MGNWIALVTLGCFCVLASYSYGTIKRPHRAAPVVITRAESCGEDWLCQLQHSSLYRPPRMNVKGHSK